MLLGQSASKIYIQLVRSNASYLYTANCKSKNSRIVSSNKTNDTLWRCRTLLNTTHDSHDTSLYANILHTELLFIFDFSISFAYLLRFLRYQRVNKKCSASLSQNLNLPWKICPAKRWINIYRLFLPQNPVWSSMMYIKRDTSWCGQC